MNPTFRVAFWGNTGNLPRSVADLPPSIGVRVSSDWAVVEDYGADVVAVPPGAQGPSAVPGSIPLCFLTPADLENPSALEEALLRAKLTTPPPQARLLGTSPAMAKVRGTLSTMAKTNLPLLLTGENGTGKDLAAVVAHEISSRSSQPFVAVNCGAVPSALAEAEFFGCVRGAFTGAENRTGFCHQALGGTLFLDEIGEMPLEIQAKLLRVIENHEIRRVGASRVEAADFRLICATNRDLGAEVSAGRFREDLFYRINVLNLKLPPLRERKEDLPVLAHHFLTSEAPSLNRRVRIGRRGLAKLSEYHWPGNLRQLRNVVLRAAVLHEAAELGPEHFEGDL